MHSAWRIALNGLTGRRRRTVLLSLTVALATALVCAASCALASLNAGLEKQVTATLGRAKVRVRQVANDRFPESVLQTIRADGEVALAVPRVRGSLALTNTTSGKAFTLTTWGIEPDLEHQAVTIAYDSGRAVERDGEIELNRYASEELGASVGAHLRCERRGPPMVLEVVGIQRPVFNDIVKRFEGRVTRATFERASSSRGTLSEIVVLLRDGIDGEQAAQRLQGAVPANVLVRPTALITSGIDSAMQAQRLGFIIAVMVATLASAFIVMTGLTTNVIERQRELALMRCAGAERWMLAQAQVMTGAIVGGVGAVIGVPLGIALAWLIAIAVPDRLPEGLHLSYAGLLLASLGAILAGMIGSTWAAVSAWRTRPLIALSGRAATTPPRTIILCGATGLLLVGVQAAIVVSPMPSTLVFWGHVLVGMPSILTGYFLIAVPVVWLMAHIAGPVVAALLRLPRAMLVRSLVATPLRNGFTAAALMLGLTMMTDLWTTGSALLRDWVDGIRFPDAFVQDLNGLNEEDRSNIEQLDFVDRASAITLMPIDASVFGLAHIKRPPTFFIAFDPESFFDMTRLKWEAGDPEYAKRRLKEGGAVIVAREFLVAREGYSIGDTITFGGQDHPISFEIVGAVTSPGLDIVGYGFDLGRSYAEMAVGTIFGSRADLQRVFHNNVVHLLQLTYSRDITDKEASSRIREALGRATALVGSGREIKENILVMGRGLMRVASAIAVIVMLIGSLGVSNIVLAGIDARRFEFGVLRAIGAARGTLARFIVGEVIILIFTACVLGTLFGLQASFTAMRFYRILAGIELHLIPQIAPIALGWAMLMTLTLLVILPLLVRLERLQPRELLAATRG